MKKLKFIFFGIIFLFLLSACQTIQDKSDKIAQKENKKLSKYIGISYEDLKIAMGIPDTETYSDDPDSTSRLVFYKTKKYGILCERRFELDENDKVIGFVSKGCF